MTDILTVGQMSYTIRKYSKGGHGWYRTWPDGHRNEVGAEVRDLINRIAQLEEYLLAESEEVQRLTRVALEGPTEVQQ